jgi:hypothetical protein
MDAKNVSRRGALGLVGLGAVLAACSGSGAASCSLTPEETEGPYYFDVDSIQSDIGRTGRGRRCGWRCGCWMLRAGRSRTSQLFFDEKVSDAVYARAPYTVHSGRDMFNRNDSIFDGRLMLTLREEGAWYLGVMSVNVRPSA